MTLLRTLPTAFAGLFITLSGASGAFLLGDDASGNKKVVNTETGEEHAVLEGIPGQPVTDCPVGAFFLARDATRQKLVITDCTTGKRFELGRDSAPVGGYPEGTFFLFDLGEAEPSRHGDGM